MDPSAHAIIFFVEPMNAHMIAAIVSLVACSITQMRRTKVVRRRIRRIGILDSNLDHGVRFMNALNELLSLNFPEGAERGLTRLFLMDHSSASEVMNWCGFDNSRP